MNHWQMIALAYALTAVALAVEVALLFRRRRTAWRQARAWRDGDEPSGAMPEDPAVAAGHRAGPVGEANS
jgi:hypothetical protein